jgi:hypothetical protein
MDDDDTGVIDIVTVETDTETVTPAPGPVLSVLGVLKLPILVSVTGVVTDVYVDVNDEGANEIDDIDTDCNCDIDTGNDSELVEAVAVAV